MHRSSRQGAAASGAAVALGALALGAPADAATFGVTNLDDAGAGSLRDAIDQANAAAGPDAVTFQAGLTGTITLTSGQLDISDSVDIQGPGTAVLAVSGNNASRVFYVYDAATLLDVTISGLTITGGQADVGAGVVSWGENLVLDNVAVNANTGSGESAGGGVALVGALDPGALTVRDSVISGNSADAGGGVFLLYAGTTLIERTTISGNDAGALGGGLAAFLSEGELTIRETTVSGNTAIAGGGLALYYLGEAATIENSTISGNQATGGNGGGIFFYGFEGGDLELRHATVSGNSAAGGGGGIYLYGGATLENTIVADNTASGDSDLASGPDSVFDLRSTLVEDPGSANLNDLGGSILNQDPQLGPLQNNGGPTPTHLPAGTSPAVDAGDNAFSLPTDQRGFARPANGTVDMGAVEVNPGTIQLAASSFVVNENAGTVTITATRTGGSDGAVSVSFATSNGTAVAPGDFAAAAGVLNWASGDMAPKTFQVTIVNDVLDEPDEAFGVTLSGPQGGAALGAPATASVTILDDDLQLATAEIPTLGDVGKILLGGLVALAGFLRLRRR